MDTPTRWPLPDSRPAAGPPDRPPRKGPELAMAASGVLALLALGLGIEQFAFLATVALLAVAATRPGVRGGFAATVHRWGMRRAWLRACRDLGLVTPDGRAPWLVRVRRVPAGEHLRVRLPRGLAAADLADATSRLARLLEIHEVRVVPDEDDARYATVTLVRRDALAGAAQVAWPHLRREQTSLWEPLPVGVDENGDEIAVRLCGRNLLLGGEPLAGKSVALSLALAGAALDPEADLTLLDSKGLEFGMLRDRAQHLVVRDRDQAVDVLRSLDRELELRRGVLNDRGQRKAERADGFRLRVIAVDELTYWLAPDHAASRELASLLVDLADCGRAVGFVVLAATHRPASLALPDELRELFGVRWALRCSTGAGADALLGEGWRELGFDPVGVGSGQRGVGYLLADGGPPVRLRAHHLDQAQLRLIAERSTWRYRAWNELDGDPAA